MKYRTKAIFIAKVIISHQKYFTFSTQNSYVINIPFLKISVLCGIYCKQYSTAYLPRKVKMQYV